MSFDHVLLNDEFTGLRPGPVKEAIDGPYREMHAQPVSPNDNLDGWQCKIGHWSLQGPVWECRETPGGKRVCSRAKGRVFDNVTLAKGDFDWRDVEVATTVTLLDKGEGWGGPVGLVFRFLDSTRFYAAVVDRDGQAKLLRGVVPNNWDVLASAPVCVRANQAFAVRVEATGDRIVADIAGVRLEAKDGEYGSGLAGFIAAQPAEFGPITVRCTEKEFRRLERVKRKTARTIRRKQRACGQPRLWKKLDTKGFGSARRIRLGDLSGNGKIDFVLTRINEEQGVECLTALGFDGKVLWRRGNVPPVPVPETSGDAPCQIHDVDGDGRNEVVCMMNHELLALDGRTGDVKYKAPVPRCAKLPELYKTNLNHWGGGYDDEGEFLPVCAITFADLTGKGARRDMVLSGHYHQTVAVDSQFKELWRCVNVHGHYPIPYRPRGEKRDHILNGYRHVDADGKTVGRVFLTDHQDAIYAGPLDDDGEGPDEILMAGGEDGVLLLTPGYDIHQRVMGHVQRLSIGKFRADIPGLCVATVLFHGNRGIITMYDSTLRRLWTRDYPVVGSTLQPVLFDDSGEERMLYSGIRPAQGHAGGLIDGFGDLVAAFPDDGGPGLCALAHDFDGDGLDEIMTWDHDRIWLYHSNSKADPGKLMKRERPPLYNMSNFQSYWSRPARTP